MFENPTPLNPQRHRSLCYRDGQGYGFARALTATPVMASEASRVAREYLLVFPQPGGNQALQALLGSEQDVNAYVGRSPKEPSWVGRYVPAHLRRYPFVALMGEGGENEGQQRLAVAIDEDAPQLSWHEGERLFTDAGEPTQVLQRVQNGLKNLYRDLMRTQRLVQQLDEAELLREQPLRLKPSGAEPTTFTGFRLIDKQRLAALSGDDLKALHDSGALALVHAHLLSLTNREDGVIAKRRQRPASPSQPQRPPAATGLGLDDDDLGNISFEGLRKP